jgi:predicted outer membrane repeat protein
MIEPLEPRRLLSKTIYVDVNSPGPTRDGTSWTNAYTDLQQGLAAAVSGDQIHVADGTYKPTAGNDRTVSFVLKGLVGMYGSYAGYGAANPDARDPLNTPTILSGDIGTIGSRSDNSYRVVSSGTAGSSDAFDGFTIRGGAATTNDGSHFSGGGFYASAGGPAITNCTFIANSAGNDGGAVYAAGVTLSFTNCNFTSNNADYGGAVYLSASTVTFSGCTFTSNGAGPDAGASGAAVYDTTSKTTFAGCTFSNNMAVEFGGAIYNNSNTTSVTVNNCTFTGNTAQVGGGIDNSSSPATVSGCSFIGNITSGSGGALNDSSSSTTITNCTFSGNATTSGGGGAILQSSNTLALTGCAFTNNSSAIYGGALAVSGGTSISATNCAFNSNTSVGSGGAVYSVANTQSFTQCVFSANSSSGSGGGLYAQNTLSVSDCTMASNFAPFGAGDSLYSVAAPTIVNSIIWTSPKSTSGAFATGAASTSITFADVQGGYSGTGNVNVDPRFLRNPSAGPDGIWGTPDDDAGDLRLSPTSPLADAGNNSAVPGTLTTDFAGSARFSDIPTTPDTGSGTAPVVDLGAYEAAPALAASAGGPYYVLAGQNLTLAGGGSSTVAGSLQYNWEWDGDGLFDDASGPSPTFTTVGYTAPTSISVSLRITDSTSQSTTSTTTINIVPPILYVDATASAATHDGSSWTNAFTDLSSALAVAVSGEQIHVAQGVFKPTSTLNRTASFQLLNGVGIYGGYGGLGDAAPNSRDVVGHPTVLSGDIGTPAIASDNTYHVVVAGDVNGTAVLDGCRITAGYANGPIAAASSLGAALYIAASSPTLNNCTFINNSTVYHGGAVYCSAGSSPTLNRCSFLGNTATSGAVESDSASPSFINCVFCGNVGSAAKINQGTALFVNCTFSANFAAIGSAIYAGSATQFTVTNCVFWGDRLFAGAPAIYLAGTATDTITFSDVEGGSVGTGNVQTDPLFLQTPSPGPDGVWGTGDDNYGDLRISAASPIVDAGQNSSVPTGVTTDLLGNARFQDVPTTTDTGAGVTPIVDMGAYEAAAALTDVAGGPYRVVQGQPLTLHGYGASDIAGTLQFSWEWTGNGAFDDGNGTSPVFLSTGLPLFTPIPVTLRVTDSAGRSTLSSTTVTVVPVVMYVDSRATGNGSGSSWANALTSLAMALASAVSGQEFHVAMGTYYATTTANPLDTFNLVNGVSLIGGYAGIGAANPDARNVTAYPTVLSGEIGTSATTDNTNHVIVGANLDNSAVLDGFTITAGYAVDNGAGIYLVNSSPVIRNCTFSLNQASSNGGALYSSNSAPSLTSCTFLRNTAGSGGAVYESSSSMTINASYFDGNSAGAFGTGGAIDASGGSLTTRNSVFVGNLAEIGGAIYAQSSANSTIVNCTVTANTGYEYFGGIYLAAGSVVNSVIWNNSAPTNPQVSAPNNAVTYCDIQGGLSGTGNMNANPLFTRSPSAGADGKWSTADDDYGDLRPQVTSPVIDAGSNAAVPAGVTTDLAGVPRIIDYPGVHDPGAIVDMGAYERGLIVSVVGTGGNESYYAKLTADGSTLNVYNSPTPTGTPTAYTVNQLESVTFDTGNGNDSLEVDIANGMFPTINYLAGGGNDSLLVTGVTAQTNLTMQPGTLVAGPTSIVMTNNESTSVDAPSAGALVNVGTLALTDRLALPTGKQAVVATSGVNITGAGALDIGDSKMIVHNASSGAAQSTLGTITGLLKSGLNLGGSWWAGIGIDSSFAAADPYQVRAIGVIVNDNGSGAKIYGSGTAKGLFGGQDALTTDVLAKPAYFGDADLSGSVNAADYSAIDNGIAMHLTGWANGDFNYDGIVNAADYSLIDTAFAMQTAAGGPLAASASTAALSKAALPVTAPAPTAPQSLFNTDARLPATADDDLLVGT